MRRAILEAHMGAKQSPPPPINTRYVAKLAKKDWLKNLQTAYVVHRVVLRHARTKSHFVRYFGAASRNMHVIEQTARTLLPPEVVDEAEAQLVVRIDEAMRAIDKATDRAQSLLQGEGVTALPEYLQAPLEVEARCTSPKIARYLELMLKADRLMTYLEALRLAGAIATNAYNHQVAVAVRDLVSVPRIAFNLAIALQERGHPERPAAAAKRSRQSKPTQEVSDPTTQPPVPLPPVPLPLEGAPPRRGTRGGRAGDVTKDASRAEVPTTERVE
jgi:hypothetical protein